MMGLKDRLTTPPQRRGSTKCKLAVVLTQLSKEDLKEVERILKSLAENEGLYTASWLGRQLTQEGFFMNHSSILRHIRKECCCAR